MLSPLSSSPEDPHATTDYSLTAPLTPLTPLSPSKRSIIRGAERYPYQHFYEDKRQSSPVSAEDVWLYPGWGDVRRDEIDPSKVEPIENKQTLGVFRSTSIAGNDLLASVLYTIGVATAQAGPLSFVSLLIICMFLWPYRLIYSEVGTALPLNGGSYNCLLNATTKFVACIAACLSLLSYTATALVSAASATAYVSGEFGEWDIFWPTIGVLVLFAILVFFGIRDSSYVALTMFSIHACVLCILIVASLVQTIRDNGKTLAENFKHGWITENPVRDVFFGFCTGLLGITGFETSSNYIEEQKPGVFPKTMNSMWVLVLIFNPTIAFLSVCVAPIADITAHTENALSVVGGAAGGEWLRKLIAIDALIVLCGGVLVGFLGVGGLIKRMAEDRCLPQFLLAKNRFTHTYHISILSFLILTVSLWAITQGDITSLSGVFAVSFLSVMCMFAVGNLVLKYKRPRLPRPVVCGWIGVFLGLFAMTAGLIGNIILDTVILAYFALYFAVTMLFVIATFERVKLMKIVLYFSRLHPLFRKYLENRCISALTQMRQHTVVFFTSTDEIDVLNKAVLYTYQNELCDHIKFVHFYEEENDIPARLEENHYIIDHVYPKIKIDLLLIKGKFTPENVHHLSTQLKIPLSFMFMRCPRTSFNYSIGDFGGVRIIVN